MPSSDTVPLLALPPGTILHGPVLPYFIATEAVVISAVFMPLVIAAILFRFYAQRCSIHGLSADDYLFTGALMCVLALGGSTIYAALMAGLGWPPMFLIGSVRDSFVKFLFASQILWGSALVLIRAGLLMFYRRLFVTPNFRLATNIVLTINGLWYITFFIGMFVKYRWTPAEEKVIEFPPWLVSQSVLDVVQDILTLVLPLFVIRSLNMKLRRKFLVSAIFLMGIVCIAASLVRLKFFVELKQLEVYSDDELYTCVTYRIYIWSVIQPAVSLITACLPSYAPAFTRDRVPGMVFAKARSLLSLSDHKDSERKESSQIPVDESYHSIEKTVGWSVRHASSDEVLTDLYHFRSTTPFDHPGRSTTEL